MEKQPRFEPYRNLKRITHFIGNLLVPSAPLCRSDHYDRTHFIPFEDEVEVLPPREQLSLYDDMGCYYEGKVEELPRHEVTNE